ncbi:MAG: TetR/AcrR family transcriptional regulator, partial [Solirubrobacteraceae bacterium]
KRRPYTPRLPPAQRREQLLDAALRVIARDGYAGVSIDAIAREAGVTRPVVYGVFDGLGALLYALLDRTEERALTQLLDAFPEDVETAPPAELIGATVRGLIETVRADPLTWRPILLAPEGTPDAVRERVDRDRDLVRKRIQALLELGLALRPGLVAVDTEIAAHALIAVAEYFGRMILAAPEEFDGERLARAVESLVAALGI